MPDFFGQRYLSQPKLIEYAKHLGLRGWRLDEVLELAERFGIVTPIARIRFPDSVARRWFRDRFPGYEVTGTVEPDGELLAASDDLEDVLSRDLMPRVEHPGNREHPLDDLLPEFRRFVTTEFTPSTFVPWSSLRAPVPIGNAHDVGCEQVYSYYHSWQALELAAFVRSGLSVLYDITANGSFEPILDLRR